MIEQQEKQGNKLTKEQMELIANKNKHVRGGDGVLPRNKYNIKSLNDPKNIANQIVMHQKQQGKVFIRSKNRTKIEVKRLEERYANPYERMGQERSHVGNLKYGTATYVDGERKEGQDAAMAKGKAKQKAVEAVVKQIDVKQIEQEVAIEYKLPDTIKTDLMAVLEERDRAENYKQEKDLRDEQMRLRYMLKEINDHISMIVARTIHREQKERTRKEIV